MIQKLDWSIGNNSSVPAELYIKRCCLVMEDVPVLISLLLLMYNEAIDDFGINFQPLPCLDYCI